jgi:16S rRNA G966 N2-methylase RsmD
MNILQVESPASVLSHSLLHCDQLDTDVPEVNFNASSEFNLIFFDPPMDKKTCSFANSNSVNSDETNTELINKTKLNNSNSLHSSNTLLQSASVTNFKNGKQKS